MSSLSVSATIHVERPADVVRRQFADVRHHQSAAVHKGVTFRVDDENSERCKYHQVTRVGPLRLRQDLELAHAPDGPLVNRITKGQFAGGAITFTVTPDGAGNSNVHAQLEAPLTAIQRLVAPLLRSKVNSALSSALAEDKHDLESGSYFPDRG